MTQSGQRAFTLIELMIIVVVMGVLMAIAIPSYKQYQVKSNRAEAQGFLMELAQRQQEYLLQSRTYAGDVDSLNATTPDNLTRNYTVTINAVSGPPPAFTITATPVAGSTQDGDGNLSLDQAGTKLWAGNPW